MEKKQNSIDWLVEQLKKQGFLYDLDIEQAKAMHKEEIEDAVNFGDACGNITTYLTVEQYYNETFGGEQC